MTKEWSEAVNAKKQQRTAAETVEKAAADLPVKEKAKAEVEQALALFEKEKTAQKERIEMKGKLEQYRNPSRSYGTAKREAERLAGIYAVKQKEAERLQEKMLAAEKKAAPTTVTNCEASGFWTEVLSLGFEDTAWMDKINSVTVNEIQYTKGTINSFGSDTNLWEIGNARSEERRVGERV